MDKKKIVFVGKMNKGEHDKAMKMLKNGMMGKKKVGRKSSKKEC